MCFRIRGHPGICGSSCSFPLDLTTDFMMVSAPRDPRKAPGVLPMARGLCTRLWESEAAQMVTGGWRWVLGACRVPGGLGEGGPQAWWWVGTRLCRLPSPVPACGSVSEF